MDSTKRNEIIAAVNAAMIKAFGAGFETRPVADTGVEDPHSWRTFEEAKKRLLEVILGKEAV
jgi:hypothetical protein